MKVKINNARAAFTQSLFEAKAYNEGQPKYSLTYILTPDSPSVTDIKKAMTAVAKEKWNEKAESTYKALRAQDRIALHDGDTKSDYAGFEGNVFVNASNSLRPTVVDRNRTPLTAADGKIYAGCYVNGIIEIWAQDNKFGKRINASLLGVQFYKYGERLSAGAGVAAEDDFEALPDEEGDLGFSNEDAEGGSDSLF